jgi:hypothetical protein
MSAHIKKRGESKIRIKREQNKKRGESKNKERGESVLPSPLSIYIKHRC